MAKLDLIFLQEFDHGWAVNVKANDAGDALETEKIGPLLALETILKSLRSKRV